MDGNDRSIEDLVQSLEKLFDNPYQFGIVSRAILDYADGMQLVALPPEKPQEQTSLFPPPTDLI